MTSYSLENCWYKSQLLTFILFIIRSIKYWFISLYWWDFQVSPLSPPMTCQNKYNWQIQLTGPLFNFPNIRVIIIIPLPPWPRSCVWIGTKTGGEKKRERQDCWFVGEGEGWGGACTAPDITHWFLFHMFVSLVTNLSWGFFQQFLMEKKLT